MQMLAKKVLISLFLMCTSALALAQGRPIEEGFDYRSLPVAQVVEQKGKVEVLEFFWYGCPHCHDFEPELSAWILCMLVKRNYCLNLKSRIGLGLKVWMYRPF